MASSASEWAREKAQEVVDNSQNFILRCDFESFALALDAAKAEGRKEAFEEAGALAFIRASTFTVDTSPEYHDGEYFTAREIAAAIRVLAKEEGTNAK